MRFHACTCHSSCREGSAHTLTLSSSRRRDRTLKSLPRRRGKSVVRSCAKRGEASRQQRKKRRLSDSDNGCTRRRATYPIHLSSYDFVMYLTGGCRSAKTLPIVGECTGSA
jgi:hypothetical protein